MGKSTVLRELELELNSSAAAVLRLQLGDFSSGGEIGSALDAPAVRVWRAGTSFLHLILDAVDEGALFTPNLAAVLGRLIRDLPADRLHLYLSCRTASWPAGLEGSLRAHFQDHSLTLLELLPLRRQDSAAEAEAQGADGDSFLRAVADVQGQSFAARPVTLRLLLDVFRDKGALPRSQVELYRTGCFMLCEELGQLRRDASLLGDLRADQRLQVAQFIAATTVLCDRQFVWSGNRSATPEGGISIDQLAVLTEDRSLVPITRSAFAEVLNTGLFTSAGDQRMGWAHRTYAEYLAASFCRERQLPIQQVRGLLFVSGEEKILPPLHEVAGWLASMRTDVFDLVLRSDPEVLLMTDAGSLSEEALAQLIDRVLDGVSTGGLLLRDLYGSARLHRFVHPGITVQLRGYLEDAGRSLEVRRAACLLALYCGAPELSPVLSQLSLDPSEPLGLRILAAQAVATIGGEADRLSLRSLATGVPEDVEDDLKGVALKALWSSGNRLVTPRELFGFLGPLRKSHQGGWYSSFLRSLGDELLNGAWAASDLLVALQWIQGQKPLSLEAQPSLCHLTGSILLAACRSCADSQVFEALLQALRGWVFGEAEGYASLGRELEAFGKALSDYSDRRREFLLRSFEARAWFESRPWGPLQSRVARLGPGDVPWLMDRLDLAASSVTPREAEVALYATLIQRRWIPERDFSRLHELFTRLPALRPLLQPVFGPIPIHGEPAEQLRAIQRSEREYEQGTAELRARSRTSGPPASQRVQQHLAALAGGDWRAFLPLAFDLATEEDDSQPDSDALYSVRLTNFPGWQAASEGTQEEVLAACVQFLQSGERDANWADHFAFMALCSLQSLRPASLADLSDEAWRRWAPAVIAFPLGSDHDHDGVIHAVVAEAYRRAPAEVITAVDACADPDLEGGRSLGHVLARLLGSWDQRLATHVVSWLDREGLGPESVMSILSHLFDARRPEVSTWCERRLREFSSANPRDEELVKLAASFWLAAEPTQALVQVRLLMVQHADTAQAAFLQLVDRASPMRGTRTAFFDLPEQDLGFIYTWLSQRFPRSSVPEADPRRVMSGVSGLEQICDFCDTILRVLVERGTPASVQAIVGIRKALQDNGHLRYSEVEARRRARASSWQRPTPEVLVQLIRDPRARRVESGADLLGLVLDSLARLQEELQGETPAVWVLWESFGRTTATEDRKLRPKREEYLSDLVAQHLRRDLRGAGLVVGREVEIRRSQLTDVRVSCTLQNPTPDRPEHVGLVIEVKGAWNKDVGTAMQTQLRDTYLGDNPDASHGVYLVGWYKCAYWSGEDSRRKTGRARTDLAQLTKELSQQAAVLSTPEVGLAAFVLDAALRGPAKSTV